MPEVDVILSKKDKKDKKELFLCLTDRSIHFEKIDDAVCTLNENNYRHSSNNQSESKNPLISAECAVFSGNLLRFILGEFQPEYYLTINSNDKKIYRVGTEVKNYKDWCEVIRVDNTQEGSLFLQWDNEGEQNILNLKIWGLTAMLVACYFVGETDWADTNFGFAKINDGFIVVRLDPGYSFNSFIINNCTVNLSDFMNDLLLNFIGKEIGNENPECEYLSELIDYERGELRNATAKTVFSNPAEIAFTVRRIVQIEAEDLHQIKECSFVKRHYDFADKLIDRLLQRQYLFKRFLCHLDSAQVPPLVSGNKTSAPNNPSQENAPNNSKISNIPFNFFPSDTGQISHKRREGDASLSNTEPPKKWRG
ncbi:hypothetical protein Lmac_1417 [Legionella maceachernii]|uniref:Uncharacterized protein n=2 Tax=Legionella maceachernii TaxID=466 RepID=A0A0W0W4C4_9GAMM|nr:hypothetical protein [Legionella maceachernii]KTD27169.1 hypothetical protein Lmac_1417 [Legionella maceachernii]SKA13640.1 hypothetical protein SAMN02745128_02239 [Legionella maceachernii]SUP04802.1 Uncharacterised protein [Legionella maceachernii]